MGKERRLGRGLEALLGRVSAPSKKPDDASDPAGDPQRVEGHSTAEAPYAGTVDEQPAAPLGVHGYPRSDYPVEPIAPPLPSDTSGTESSGAAPSEEVEAPASRMVPVSAADMQEAAAAVDPLDAGPPRVDVSQIDSNPFQPRQDFDEAEMESLGESLRDHGLLQPVIVRKVDDRFQLVAGERRLRAAKEMGWTEVPVQLTEADDRQMAELAIVENLQRKDLNPIEKAASFQRYLQQYGCTQEELASRLKLDRSTVANLIRLLELPEPVRAAVRGSKITQGHARALLALGEEREQVDFCRRIETERLSVRQTEAAVHEAIQEADADAEPLGVVARDGTTSRPARPRNEHITSLEQEFRAALGTKVKITHNVRGRGKLVIHFANHEEFERLRRHFCEPEPVDLHSEAG